MSRTRERVPNGFGMSVGLQGDVCRWLAVKPRERFDPILKGNEHVGKFFHIRGCTNPITNFLRHNVEYISLEVYGVHRLGQFAHEIQLFNVSQAPLEVPELGEHPKWIQVRRVATRSLFPS